MLNNRLLLIINPVAGKGRGKSALFKAVDIFSKHGYRVTVLPTEPNGATERKIINEIKDYSLCVAIGGDGTLNTVVNGIMKSESLVPLGYIPLGSTNDYAASLKLPKEITTACERIATREPKFIDIGRFGDRYFAYIACTGMFAAASYMTSQQLKNALGHSAYLIKGLYSLKDTKKTFYKIVTDEETIQGEFLFCSVSNTLRAGGVIWLPKNEVLFDDGELELTLLKAPTTIAEGSAMVNDLLYSRLETETFIRRKIKRAEITVGTKSGWSLDGENGGEHNTANIVVLKNALKLVY